MSVPSTAAHFVNHRRTHRHDAARLGQFESKCFAIPLRRPNRQRAVHGELRLDGRALTREVDERTLFRRACRLCVTGARYDLVSVVQYPSINHELAMAWGDAFTLEDVTAFELAAFAQRCGVDRQLLRREAKRISKLATEHAPLQAQATDYVDDAERAFAGQLRDFVVAQAARLKRLAEDPAKIETEYL